MWSVSHPFPSTSQGEGQDPCTGSLHNQQLCLLHHWCEHGPVQQGKCSILGMCQELLHRARPSKCLRKDTEITRLHLNSLGVPITQQLFPPDYSYHLPFQRVPGWSSTGAWPGCKVRSSPSLSDKRASPKSQVQRSEILFTYLCMHTLQSEWGPAAEADKTSNEIGNQAGAVWWQ